MRGPGHQPISTVGSLIQRWIEWPSRIRHPDSRQTVCDVRANQPGSYREWNTISTPEHYSSSLRSVWAIWREFPSLPSTPGRDGSDVLGLDAGNGMQNAGYRVSESLRLQWCVRDLPWTGRGRRGCICIPDRLAAMPHLAEL